jgi:hypothetical protein
VLVLKIQEGGELLGAELPYPNGYVLAEHEIEELLLLGTELRANRATRLIGAGFALNWGPGEGHMRENIE